LGRPLILLKLLLDDVEVRVELFPVWKLVEDVLYVLRYLCLEVPVELDPAALLRRREGLKLQAQTDQFVAQFGDFFLSRHG